MKPWFFESRDAVPLRSDRPSKRHVHRPNGRNETPFRLIDAWVDPRFGRDGACFQTVTQSADAIDRLRGMFLDVPGTRLSVADAARLSGVEYSMCGDVLETLFDACFLKRRDDGTFVRRQTDTVDR
jgi:hypothetical protein